MTSLWLLLPTVKTHILGIFLAVTAQTYCTFTTYILFKSAPEHIFVTMFNACTTAWICFMELQETWKQFRSYCCKINLSAIENCPVCGCGIIKARKDIKRYSFPHWTSLKRENLVMKSWSDLPKVTWQVCSYFLLRYFSACASEFSFMIPGMMLAP